MANDGVPETSSIPTKSAQKLSAGIARHDEPKSGAKSEHSFSFENQHYAPFTCVNSASGVTFDSLFLYFVVLVHNYLFVLDTFVRSGPR